MERTRKAGSPPQVGLCRTDPHLDPSAHEGLNGPSPPLHLPFIHETAWEGGAANGGGGGA